MIVPTLGSAQVVIILLSQDAEMIGQLKRDLLASKIGYFLAILSDQETLRRAAADRISEIAGIAPVVMVIDYNFARHDCDLLLRETGAAPYAATIACIVVNPPRDAARRQSLIAGGARLFDGDSAETAEQLTLQ